MAENRIRRHVPDGTLCQMEILTFDEALAEAQRPNDAYDVNRWLFVPPRYTEYRRCRALKELRWDTALTRSS